MIRGQSAVLIEFNGMRTSSAFINSFIFEEETFLGGVKTKRDSFSREILSNEVERVRQGADFFMESFGDFIYWTGELSGVELSHVANTGLKMVTSETDLCSVV